MPYKYSPARSPGRLAAVQHVRPLHLAEGVGESLRPKQQGQMPDLVVRRQGVLQAMLPKHQLLSGNLRRAKSAHRIHPCQKPCPSITAVCTLRSANRPPQTLAQTLRSRADYSDSLVRERTCLGRGGVLIAIQGRISVFVAATTHNHERWTFSYSI